MTSMTTNSSAVTGGVDTHGQTHHGAALDSVGRQLGDREFLTTPAGYRALVNWLQTYGHLERVGVEGTGTYGAGLTRQLCAAGVTVVEVDRPDRKARRAQGSPTRWTPTRQRAPRWPAKPPASPRPKTAVSRQSAYCV
jgi:transposase